MELSRRSLADDYVVTIFAHDVESQLGPIACYSYVTDGLRMTGQKEMILTISNDRQEAEPPTLPFAFFAKVHELALEGRLVDVGDLTDFRRVGFMGKFRGVLYERAQSLPGVPVPADALAVILATEDEIEVAWRCGISRILVRLGDSYRYFPFPPWSDRARSSVVSQDFWRQSIFSQNIPTLHAHGTTVRREANCVYVCISPTVSRYADELVPKLTSDSPVALLANLDPQASAMIVWRPGLRTPEAITGSDQKGEPLGGCFIILAGQSDTNGSELFEDGFVMKLTKSAITESLEALRSGRPIAIRDPAGSPVFELSLMEPADAKKGR